ncbi:unnamed protein product, partial [marine sediment metagenome]
AIKGMRLGSLMPRRLNWKTGIIGILALALVVSLAVTIPPLFGQNYKVLAADIALNSLEVQIALGGKEPEEVEVVDFVDDREYAFVILKISPELIFIAEVDMEAEEVVQVHVLELTDEVKQEIIDIAKTNPGVQGLFEQGAYVSNFQATYSVNTKDIIGPEGKIHREGSVELMVGMILKLREEQYIVMVDLTTGEVVNLANAQMVE